jgi:hypothetical protein
MRCGYGTAEQFAENSPDVRKVIPSAAEAEFILQALRHS